MAKKKIVVLGGGFAGIKFIKHIDKRQFEVTLVDRNNYNCFPPLFYQVASSGLDPTDISFAFRRELRKYAHQGVRFHMGTVLAVDVKSKSVTTDHEILPYDHLVIALGTTNNFFGDNTLIDKVYTLKSIGESIRIRNEVLRRCEMAAIEPDEAKRRQLLSFVVVGGGPAGVEMAGAIGEVKRYIIKREYPEIQPDEMSIRLIEGANRLLHTMSNHASATALEDLEKLMVDVTLGRIMKSFDGERVTLDDGSVIDSSMVVWTAGVSATPFDINGLADGQIIRGHGGRIVTDDCLRVSGIDSVYALGDIGYFETPKFPKGLPQVAQVAIQEGKYLAKVLNANSYTKPFEYRDKGSMAAIGRGRAVADIGSRHMSGFMAWLAWMFIHLISLLGMRNKISVLVNWTWAYFTHNTALRLLLKGSVHPRPTPSNDHI